MSFWVVIPARFGSRRLPGKPLAEIAGRALIWRVCERALASDAAKVIVATDDTRIKDACHGLDVEVCMSARAHRSGTDRIAEVVRRKNATDVEIVVNLQGDEPLMPAAVINQVAALLVSRTQSEMATLATPIRTPSEFSDPNVVKVVRGRTGRALYFSRAPIPWQREEGNAASSPAFRGALRHIGIYAYRSEPLLALSREGYVTLESVERLEQLRALWLGFDIAVDIACRIPGPSIDTPADLDKASRLIQEQDGDMTSL